MTDAAFKATFEDFRIVKGRKVCQLVLEVPLEGADKALEALGGLPRPDDPMWVGVARMGRKEPTEKPKRSWDETPLSEQVAIRSAKPHFREWLATYWGDPEIMDRSSCDLALKRRLQIKSKTEIKPGTFAGSDWLALDQEYQDSCGLIAERTT